VAFCLLAEAYVRLFTGELISCLAQEATGHLETTYDSMYSSISVYEILALYNGKILWYTAYEMIILLHPVSILQSKSLPQDRR
jgi:hypothetical protein